MTTKNLNYTKEARKQIADTIIEQLGGKNKLVAMIGAHSFFKTETEGNAGVIFRFKSKSKYKICCITLNAMDTYDMKLLKTHKGKITKEKRFDDIYNDMLINCFQSGTGLAISL